MRWSTSILRIELLSTHDDGLAVVQGVEAVTFGLAADGLVDPAALGKAVDDLATPSLIAIFLMFLPGALFGVIISGVALWRARAVPRAAVLLIFAFLVLDIPLQQGLAAHAVALVAAVWIAATILRSGRAAG